MRKNKGGKGFNKQGIRSLDHIKGKSVGIRLEEPPISEGCPHPPDRITIVSEQFEKCGKCGKILGEI